MMNQTDWLGYLSDNADNYAYAAWEGYQKWGRGCLVLNFKYLRELPDGRHLMPIQYMTVDDPRIRARGGWPVENIPKLIEEYDPESQMVVLMIEPDGRTTAGRFGPIPIKHIDEENRSYWPYASAGRGH